MVGYVGQFDMLLAWLLTRLRAVPLVFNPLVSLYDTFCADRGLVRPSSLSGRMLWLLDVLACRAADLIVIDTDEHAAYFAQHLRVPRERLYTVVVGADDRFFRRHPLPTRQPGEPLDVLFVGKLIPLHGVEHILHAAALLADAPLHFTLVGSGQHKALAQELVQTLGLRNVTLVDWIDYASLPQRYAEADICLGIFGGSEKAMRVVPNKVFQAMAVGRPVLTADSPAIRATFQVGTELLTCAPADPADLARQLRSLVADADLRARLAAQSYAAFEERGSIAAVARQTLDALAFLLPGLRHEDQMEWGAQPGFYGPRHRFREDYLYNAVREHSPGALVLDAACGAGTLARRLAQAGYHIVGADLSTDFVRYIQQNNSQPPVRVLQGDIFALPSPANQFDSIVAGEVLEHLDNDSGALCELRRVLRPGGVCIISVPANPEQWDWHDNWAGHVRRYTREEMAQRLQQAGFQVRAIHYFGFPFVRMFHRYVYLPRYRRTIRTYAQKLDRLKVQGMRYRIVSTLLLKLFQLDNLFNRFPLGIGLIAIAQKPENTPD
jgi:2-polyprenyl-3-methyl-5-hydroxy-6-metoxy-1,4-benzoquinol methylase/glycosyltransferase involved in cell wall biosynthesis